LQELKKQINEKFGISIKFKKEKKVYGGNIVSTNYFLNINGATTVVEGTVNDLKNFVLKLVKYEYDKAVEKTDGNTPSNVLGSINLMKFRLFLKMVFKALKMY